MVHAVLILMVFVGYMDGINISFVLVTEAYAMGELAKCEKVAAVGAWRDHNTLVETSLRTLAGTWISEGYAQNN